MISAMLLPASGDARLSPPDKFRALQPQVVLLAVEPGETRGLPARSLVESRQGRPILRTDHHGWIKLTTNGMRMWVEEERPTGLEAEETSPFRLDLELEDFILLRAD